jgi:serine/threonine-protein kinase
VKTHVGPYRIEEMLGRGGMGVVYRGTHEHLGRQVAIKELAPELTQQPEFKERFFAEARTQARLHHPNIVTVFDLLEEQGEFFIVMEYVAGRTCDELLKENAGRGLGLGEAAGIFSQVLAALDYAHSEGVIHRDVKPSNVLLTADGRVKLMDFGIALLVGDKRLTSSQASIGTPIYMSPEQILRPREMDHRTDIYSAAIVFYEMLAGAPPFDAESMYEINKLQIEAPPPDLSLRNPAVPAAVTAVVARALAKSPDERFMSAGEMLRALREALPAAAGAATVPSPAVSRPATGASLTGTPTSPLPRTLAPPAAAVPAQLPAAGSRKGWPLWKVLVPAGAAMAILVAVALGFFLKGSPSPVPTDSGTEATLSPTEPPAVAGTPAAAPTIPMPAQIPAQSNAPVPAAVEEPNGGLRPVDLEPVVRVAASGIRPSNGTRPENDLPQRPSSPPDNRKVDQETRQREVARVHETLRNGIAGVREDLEAQRFSAARERLNQLQETAVPYRADLMDDVASLRALEQEITSQQISSKTAALTRQQEEAGWQRRLQEIRGLLQDKRYPEAQTLANRLAGDAGVPEAVANEARDLNAQAEQEMKNIFHKATVKTKDEVVKKPPR